MDKNTNVILQSINVNIIDTNSGIFVGENKQYNWKSTVNTTTGFSIKGSKNLAARNITSIVKKDF
ncbi:hypothetical protein AWH56_017960 [Anaerobacillus isosaccharinicus]|uniref:Uncharacterized protein n=1 Tax=Anaerobacillus isosaccharinicus TaxID=1532552 RepID=A0A1S2M9J1_9BACI|nr:hypothetical protein [Anaerobacillus isosaccharinicus]MBA5587209.1 hypothetical protein [Anaerobacillus isosaccharinicus]QOY34597.1 hypothetical protein AWH56_017960 [Anaerobacillus isosaccharinicus]